MSCNNKVKDTSQKLIGLKQLKEFISEIFASKFKYDAKCKELQVPIETME
jgi:hypothetical protein